MTELLKYLKATLIKKEEKARLAYAFHCKEGDLVKIAEQIVEKNEQSKLILWYKAAITYIPVEMVCPNYNLDKVRKLLLEVFPPLSDDFWKLGGNMYTKCFMFGLDGRRELMDTINKTRKIPISPNTLRSVYKRYFEDKMPREEYDAITCYFWSEKYHAVHYKFIPLSYRAD